MFFRYGSNNDDDDHADADDEQDTGVERPRWQTALVVASLTLLHGLAVIVVTGILSTLAKEHLPTWANVLGVMAAILAAVQYIPQIWTTYHLKHVGSLSIPMMCIQTPGGFVFAASLFARLGWGGWSSWGIFVLTATMQGVLLSMAIYYEVQAHAGGADSAKSHTNGLDHNTARHTSDARSKLQTILNRQDSDTATDTTPLLRNGGARNSHQSYDTNRR